MKTITLLNPKPWLAVIVVALNLCAGSAGMAADWQAQWIGPANEAQTDRRNSWYCFRKTLAVSKAPKDFPVRIACDSKYWLWVNGQAVVFEGGLKRGPTPTGTYFDVVDLAPFLKTGDNTVALLLWHFGKHGFSHNDSGKVGLVVDGASGQLTLRSDSTWRVLRYAAFEDANDPAPNYRLPEGNIRFDARKAMPDWQTKASVADWPSATEYGRPPTGPWGELVERPIPQWKDYGLRDYVTTVETTADKLDQRNSTSNPERIAKAATKQKQEKAPDRRRVLVGTLPYNAHVHPYLSITAPAGLKIDLQTDLLTNGRDNLLRAEYITREGEQEFECPGWINGHEVRYFLPEGVKVKAVKFRETGYNAEFVGKFECDDSRLNTLWEKSRRTLYVTMRDTYMDCPDRERAQWWGDAVNEIGEAFFVFD
ncbi:MAG: glycoside hydrolase, partial [Verrucomicrobia bacterium]|nr:glycoside hydrolase [Verrucomicrobiota bacterium]